MRLYPGTSIAKGKAYLPQSVLNGTSASTLTFVFGTPSGISRRPTSNNPHPTVIYTLQGLRVKTMTMPGLYLVNGEKIMIK
jgi:hypothetical protein